ncbi:MAG: SpoIID/LytB domain-containing protein [Solirubrobacterales bacterium]
MCRHKWLQWISGFLLTLIIAGLIPALPARAVTCPDTIKVGLSTVETNADFRIVSGNYQLFLNDDPTPVASFQTLCLYRVSFMPLDNTMHLYGPGPGGLFSDLGVVTLFKLAPDPTSPGPNVFSYNAKSYRGAVQVFMNRTGMKLNVINELPLDQYLYGVVPKEMSNQWPLEALKAQAVAARTYVLKNISKHSADGFSVCAATHCQAYGGYAYEGDASRAAVDQTSRQVLLDKDGRLASTLYHSNSGGYTEDNMNVNGYNFDYLKGKPDPYSMGNGLSDWRCVVALDPDGSGNSIQERVYQKNPNIGRIVSITTAKYVSGRVYQVTLIDEAGLTVTMRGGEFGQMFNPGFTTAVNKDNFMGTMFVPKSDASVAVLGDSGTPITAEAGIRGMSVRSAEGIRPASDQNNTYTARSADGVRVIPKSAQYFTFEGHGWGHGVGMSQWGAYGMANLGKTYIDILIFYYEGTQVLTL